MKKIISLVAALSMTATVFASFVTVASAETTTGAEYDVKAEVMTNEEYKGVTGNDIPEDTAAYHITVDASKVVGNGHYMSVATGLFNDTTYSVKSGIGTVQFVVKDIENVHHTVVVSPFGNTEKATIGATSSHKAGGEVKYSEDEKEIKNIMVATKATDAYPTAAVAYTSPIDTIDGLVDIYVVLENTVAFTADYAGFVEYKAYDADGKEVGNTKRDDFTGTLSFAGVGPKDVPATSISIIGPSVYVANVGGTGALGTSVEPSNTTDTVVWSSSDDTVVEITEEGTWTAKKPGKATLTATAGTKTASVVVKVKPKFTCGTKWTSGNDIVWGNSKIEAPVFGTNFKGVLSDGTDSKEVALSGDLEATGDITFDVVVKVINTTAGELTFDVTCDAAE